MACRIQRRTRTTGGSFYSSPGKANHTQDGHIGACPVDSGTELQACHRDRQVEGDDADVAHEPEICHDVRRCRWNRGLLRQTDQNGCRVRDKHSVANNNAHQVCIVVQHDLERIGFGRQKEASTWGRRPKRRHQHT